MSSKPSLSITLLRAYLKFYFQTKRFLIVFIIYLFLSLLGPTLIATGVIQKAPTVYDFTGTALSNLSSAIVLACAILAGDAVSQDFSRQGLFTLTQPISRARILLARYLAAFIASAGVFILSYYLVVAVTGYLFYGKFIPNILEVAAMGLLLTASMVAFVMLFSSLVKNPAVSVLLSVIVVLIGMGVINGIAEVANVEPWFLLTYAGGAVSGLALQTYPQHIQSLGIPWFNVNIYTPYVSEAIEIMAAYLLISIALAYLVYSRRELRET